ncbi:MAG: hypothetical protein LBU70_07320, partial [Chitinispirillales bacterium]|nr:hypothetical protein [Chitinispirillales bacterium]
MKHSLLFVSIATFFITCGVSDINGINENTNYVPDVPQIAVKERPCEILEYVGKIGNDFDSALDSLRKLPG